MINLLFGVDFYQHINVFIPLILKDLLRESTNQKNFKSSDWHSTEVLHLNCSRTSDFFEDDIYTYIFYIPEQLKSFYFKSESSSPTDLEFMAKQNLFLANYQQISNK